MKKIVKNYEKIILENPKVIFHLFKYYLNENDS